MMRRALATIASASLIASCGPAARLRWSPGSMPVSQSGKPTLSITSVALEPIGSGTFKDLPAESGSAYVTALAAKTTSAGELIAMLASPIRAPNMGDQDRTVLQRVIAVDVSPGGYEAGKRLVRTRVHIRPLGGFHFAGYTLVKTEYQTVDLETITSSRKTTGSLTLKPELGGVVEAVEAGVGFENNDQTVYLNKERSRDLSIAFSPKSIVLTRDGIPNGDLAGTTIIKASVRPVSDGSGSKPNDDGSQAPPAVHPYVGTFVLEQKLFAADGSDLAPPNASIRTAFERLWRPQSLRVCASLDYVERRIVKGREFYDEGKQQVNEVAGSTDPVVYELVPEADTEAVRFLVHDTLARQYLNLEGPTGARPFSFTSAVAAATFAEWVSRTGANTVGNRAITLGDDQIPSLRGRELQVRRVSDGGSDGMPLPGAPC